MMSPSLPFPVTWENFKVKFSQPLLPPPSNKRDPNQCRLRAFVVLTPEQVLKW